MTASGARTSARETTPHPIRRWPMVVAIAVIAVVALNLIWLPLMRDQSLMSLIGYDLRNGYHLYTDIFDAKQPALYFWYASIEAVFGPNQPVMQLFSVLAALVSAWLLYRLVAPRLSSEWLRRWAWILASGALVLPLFRFDLGQAELLVWLPAVGALVLIARTPGVEPAIRRSLFAGLCLGLVAVTKTFLVIAPGLAVLCYLLLAVGRGRRLRHIAAVCAGGVVLPAIVLGWLALSGDLSAALNAWFVFPEEVLAIDGLRSLDVLWAAVGRFVVLLAAVWLLALWRIPTVLRRRDPLDVALLAWVVGATVGYLSQLWWDYYLTVLIPGLVGLALRQLDDLLKRPERPRRIALAVTAVLTVPLVVYGLLGAGRAVLDGGGVTQDSRDQIAQRVGDYGTMRAELAAANLRPTDRLYVFGDARWQLLSGRRFAIPTAGGTPQYLPVQRWHVVADELRQFRPEVIFVDPAASEGFQARGAEAQAVLNQLYVVTRTSEAGTWYRLRA